MNLSSLSAIHLKGSQNSLADFLSRQHVCQDEWSLNINVFREIVQCWGQPEVDLFASEANKKVAQFFSIHPRDQATGIDAFANPWQFNMCYAFPPVWLIAAVLQKFLAESTDLILVAPFWPKRPWFANFETGHLYSFTPPG